MKEGRLVGLEEGETQERESFLLWNIVHWNARWKCINSVANIIWSPRMNFFLPPDLLEGSELRCDTSGEAHVFWAGERCQRAGGLRGVSHENDPDPFIDLSPAYFSRCLCCDTNEKLNAGFLPSKLLLRNNFFQQRCMIIAGFLRHQYVMRQFGPSLNGTTFSVAKLYLLEYENNRKQRVGDSLRRFFFPYLKLISLLTRKCRNKSYSIWPLPFDDGEQFFSNTARDRLLRNRVRASKNAAKK